MEIPDLPLTDYVLAGGAGQPDKPAGCEVIQGYGMTELSPVSHLTPPGWLKPGSVGISAPSTQTKIADPVTGADLGTGEEGARWRTTSRSGGSR